MRPSSLPSCRPDQHPYPNDMSAHPWGAVVSGLVWLHPSWRLSQRRTEMVRKWLAAMAIVGVAVSTAGAQDARTMLGNASKAMGTDGLNSIYFYGTAQAGNLGQNNNANQPWPMAAQNDYVRAIDFSQPASRATWASYAVPVTGGRATLAQGTPQTQQLITPQSQGWANQLEIWVTPWGFLKGAAANNATVKGQTVGGRRYQVVTWNSPVKSPGGAPYKVVGYINS